MAALTQATPIYEGLLALATDDERAQILAGGPRWMLDHNIAFGGDADRDNAIQAYAAIKQVLIRVAEKLDHRLTGINRDKSLSRETVELEDAIAGRLLWEEPDGRRSKLLIDGTFPTVHVDNLQIEPVASNLLAPTPLLPPARVQKTERINDAAPLAKMRAYVDSGMLRKTAARKVVREMSGSRTIEQEDSIVRRLQRKFGA